MAFSVLIVEDERLLREITREILLLNGFEVHIADNTKMAYDALSDSDVLLCDVNLGEENGIDFIRQIRKNGNKIPSIVMSGITSDENERLAKELTGRPLLRKPFTFNTLLALIDKACLELK